MRGRNYTIAVAGETLAVAVTSVLSIIVAIDGVVLQIRIQVGDLECDRRRHTTRGGCR
jgi:hypothetical protein